MREKERRAARGAAHRTRQLLSLEPVQAHSSAMSPLGLRQLALTTTGFLQPGVMAGKSSLGCMWQKSP